LGRRAVNALAGIAFFLIFGQWLLPDRRPAVTTHGDPREYTAEPSYWRGPLVGRSIEEAGLRLCRDFPRGLNAPGGDRAFRHANAQGGDRLVFAGVLDSVVDLPKCHGLARALGKYRARRGQQAAAD
jgi:hypothetical protein